MDEADRLCNSLAIIDGGKIIVLGPPARLKQELGGDIIHLKGAGCNGEAIKGLPFVTAIHSDDDGISITVQDAGRNLQELLGRVGPVDSVEVRPVTLEDVFLHHTGRAIREGTPEGGWAEKAMAAGSRR